MKARDVENAERLFQRIQTARITELVKSEHPMFRNSQIHSAMCGRPILNRTLHGLRASQRRCPAAVRTGTLGTDAYFSNKKPGKRAGQIANNAR
jgi:hypothetical protein